MVMRHTPAKWLLLVLMGLLAPPCWSQQTAHITQTKAFPAKSAPKVTPASQLVFGSIGIASKSVGARQQLELALDRYENAQYADAILHAKQATEKDPNCALAYALWSYAARWIGNAPEALQRAQLLSTKSAADEKLLVKFMAADAQQRIDHVLADTQKVQPHAAKNSP